MSLYEIIILLIVFGAVVYLAAYNMGRYKAKLEHELEQRAKLEERIAKLEQATDKPIGYNQMAAFDELTAYLIGIEKRCQVAREFSNAAKRGNFNGQKKD